MSDLEAMVMARTGKRLDQCTAEELKQLMADLDAEGKAHKAHADELLNFAAKRRAARVANDNAPSGDAA